LPYPSEIVSLQKIVPLIFSDLFGYDIGIFKNFYMPRYGSFIDAYTVCKLLVCNSGRVPYCPDYFLSDGSVEFLK
uniref:hypothetical protein n=1 Tax=Methanogenium cariaci TaxID=2197 RepID=UPI001FDFC234